jgi:hypothetical protein
MLDQLFQYCQLFDVSLELVPGYKNGSSVTWDVFSGKLLYTKNTQFLDGSSSNNYFILADIPGILLILEEFGAYETVIYPDSSIVVFNNITQKFQMINAGPISRSVDTSSTSKNIDFIYNSSTFISDSTEHTHVTAFSTQNEFIVIQAQTPVNGPGIPVRGHVLSVYDLSDAQNPLVISTDNILTTNRTDIPVYLRFLESTYYNNKATLLCLNLRQVLILSDSDSKFIIFFLKITILLFPFRF